MVIYSLPIQAEEQYSNSTYWNEKCLSKEVVDVGDYEACATYRSYMLSQSGALSSTLQQVESNRQRIAQDIASFNDELLQYKDKSNHLKSQIASLQTQIEEKQAEVDTTKAKIEETQQKIDENQKEVDALTAKMKARLQQKQPSMHFPVVIDVIFGAKSFLHFLRLAGVMDMINRQEKQQTERLMQAIEQLNKDKVYLEQEQQRLENDLIELNGQKKILDQQNQELYAIMATIQLIQEENEKQSALLEAKGQTIVGNLNAIRGQMLNVSNQLQEFVDKRAPEGFTPNQQDQNFVIDPIELSEVHVDTWQNPVPNAIRSAGTWNYPNGGVHLGYDFAASAGSDVYAVGDGVILHSANGCPSFGGVGDSCGGNIGGSTGGGNQAYLLTIKNGKLYVVKYLHLMLNTVVGTGSIVRQGEYIGRVGSSGNSTGPHCHVEIFYVGEGSQMVNYAKNWNGDLSFGAGWAFGSSGTYGRRCEDGVGAPCRIRPELYY